MQARDVFLTQLIQGPKQFLIPIFQRKYSWKEPHCQQLFQDILRAGASQRTDSHFTGSVVLIPNHHTMASIPQWQVIDGQQRLTTVTLLMAALASRAAKLGMEKVGMTPLKAIRGYFLTNEYGQDEAVYKLLLTKGDREALCALIDGKIPKKNLSKNVVENFQLFCEWLVDIQSIEKVFQGFQKLKVVEVVLQQGQDDPQAIFESLNSTGVDLSQADLIRNYVLMRQQYEAQTRLYLEYWYPMEQLFGSEGSYRFDRFMQDFLTLETGSSTLLRSQDVYTTFKVWFSEQLEEQDAEKALKRLLKLARCHAAFMFGAEQDKPLLEAFKRLRSLAEVVSPTVMRLYEAYSPHGGESTLNKSDFIQAVGYLESYLLRRQVCGMQTRSLGNIFANLAQQLDLEEPLETLMVALARFRRNSRFPSNSEFEYALKNHELYGLRILKFLLSNIENRGSKEKIDTSNFSIEHIMPQNENLRVDWQNMLGDGWREVQQKWVHRLGNLTLTGYNPEYSDKSFEEKKSIENGFNDSPLRLNRYVKDQGVWTETQIRERGEELVKKALNIWSALDVDSKLVAEYELRDRQARSNQYDIEGVLGKGNVKLYDALQEVVLAMGDDITPIVSKKNVTFYTLSGFLQVVPRSGYLGLIMSVEQEELDPELAQTVDPTHQWSYIRHGNLSGVYSWVSNEEHIQVVLPIIQQAYEQALS
ncbi:DUF262 and DUF1524 domain-containing protein [Halomonas sp. OfavH-34-E]|uniref:DUF262 and DUF1524 domain-containing protein n=1 Tax=Halomonas sp. OfavH-34-E TaxID=2954491 RepID=UPI0020976589|nr:DUF262 and DUF1524 domain-containing protein [Halomonas sp. OfavH-34-E]MCO7216605.1 DUF262 domain-containing protein [Halomonas sp. OfavH-34-E]